MKTRQLVWLPKTGWQTRAGAVENPQLVLFFAAPSAFKSEALQGLSHLFPSATVAGCSTGGEIIGPDVFDNAVVATAIEFEHSSIKTAATNVSKFTDSTTAGKNLAQQLSAPDLRMIIVLSDGLKVKGTELASAINSVCTQQVAVVGGLAGDGANFSVTLCGVNGEYAPGMLVGIGIYGDHLAIGHGSQGGWDSFGPKRKVTRSEQNVLYELDGEPALDLYKRYLGEESKNLPSSALLFPLSLELPTGQKGEVVRTILGVDEQQKSMTFAGDIPQGGVVRLMRANLDRLVLAAGTAAQNADGNTNPQLAILVSCIGRKLILGQRAVEEAEAVSDALGSTCATMGFYSYGELCPLEKGGLAELHNQTMTVSTISETN
jgi:hypothetical protein